MSIAFLFPGQGAQFIGMCQELYEDCTEVRRLFTLASSALGYDTAKACFEGSDEVLNATEYTQPLLLPASVAAHAAFAAKRPGINPALMVGLSLGEYSALVVSGSIDFLDALAIVRLRGQAMQEAVAPGVGSMAAVNGLGPEQVVRLCREVSTNESWVEPANYNCPGQIVVSGHVSAVKSLCKMAKDHGANKAVRLPVSAPFHNRLLRPAGEILAGALEKVTIRGSKIPVVSNVTARPITAAEERSSAL